MNLQEIKTYLETNKDNEDVKNYLAELSKVTVEGVDSFINTEDGKKWIGKHNDSFFTKGLESWKKNNLDKLISDAVAKANPQETPEQKQIRELTERLNKKESDEKRQVVKNHALTHANTKKLPIEILDFFLGEDEDTTTQNLIKLEEIFNKHIQTTVEERLKSGSYVPPGDSGNKNEQELLKEQIRKSISTVTNHFNWH